MAESRHGTLGGDRHMIVTTTPQCRRADHHRIPRHRRRRGDPRRERLPRYLRGHHRHHRRSLLGLRGEPRRGARDGLARTRGARPGGGRQRRCRGRSRLRGHQQHAHGLRFWHCGGARLMPARRAMTGGFSPAPDHAAGCGVPCRAGISPSSPLFRQKEQRPCGERRKGIETHGFDVTGPAGRVRRTDQPDPVG